MSPNSLTSTITPNAVVPLQLLGAIAAAVLSVGLEAPASAQIAGDLEPSASSPTRWGLGVAALSRELPYAGAEKETRGVPVLYVENRWFRLAGGTADLKLWRHEFSASNSFSTGLRVKFEDVGYKPSDSPVLAGMDKRKSSAWAGLSADWTTPWIHLGAEWTAAASESKGQKFQLQADRRFSWGAFGATPRLRAVWMDKKYVDYYFGVRDHEVTAARAPYLGKAGLSTDVGLRFDYALTRHHQVFVDASVTKLPNEVRDSPIVGRKDTSQVAVGYMYRF